MLRVVLILVFAGALISPAAAFTPTAAGSRYLHALAEAKHDYAKIAKPGEAARADYVTRLARLRDKAADANTDTWQAIDAEIKQHPAPKDSDSKALSALRVGEWESPRHDYLYRAGGTWTMLPAEPDATHGTWRIDGNQCFETVATDPPLASHFTIILLSKTDFIFTDQDEDVFYETRLK